ncbi:MAG: DUF262 domain-containing protein [Chitinophagaceae bacterium]|nr:MAG: DUF262 domain-containing protein [Chitinophagaceae bacterium]
MENIEAKKKELKELLSREYFFRVPEYQRPYSWDQEHFTDLIQDLIDAKKDQEYFLGTIVVHKKDGVNDVVDGQQRLTTIMILLACLRDMIDDKDFKLSIQEKIIQKENIVDGIPEKVRIEVKDREIFNELIITENGTKTQKEGESLAEPQWRYVTAIKIFNEKLKNFSQENLRDFTKFISQKCILVYLSTNTFEDAFRLFIIVNDRGKQLRRIDILKASNISPTVIKSDVVRNSLSQKWEEWEKNLGGETFEQVIFLLRLLLIGEKSQYDLLVEFEERIFKKGLVSKGEKFIDVVCDYASMYNDLFEDYSYFDTNPNKIRIIGLLYIMNNEFKSNEWKAVLLLYLKKFKQKEIETLLSMLEMKYIEGWISGSSTDVRIVAAGNIIKAINTAKKPADVFTSDSLKVDKDKMLHQLGDEIYGKQYCKYILLRLELLASENDVEKKIKAKSIEHVLPQTPKGDSKWLNDFTLEERKFWLNRLANLVLLSKSKNSSASNYEFNEKKNKYLREKVSDYPRSIEILGIAEWTPEQLQTRQNLLLEKALDDIFI